MGVDDGKIYIAEMALELARSEHTIRQWLREKKRAPDDITCLPDDLIPHREGGRDRIFWLPEQLSGMRTFADERERRRGWQGQTS